MSTLDFREMAFCVNY